MSEPSSELPNETQPFTASAGSPLPVALGGSSAELILPGHLARQLACLAEISYPFESTGFLIGRRVGEQNLIEQVTYLDPSEVPKGRLLPGYEALQAARDSLEPAGLEVIGVWRAESCCTEAAEGVQAEDVVAEISYLSVSVPALGSARFRSWRRVGGALIEESLK